MKKEQVTVETEKGVNGTHPVSVILPNGRYYRIDKVMHYAVSPDEYEGVRYAVLIGKRERFLYRTGDSWYVLV